MPVPAGSKGRVIFFALFLEQKTRASSTALKSVAIHCDSGTNLLPSTEKTASRRFLYVCGRLLMSSVGTDFELGRTMLVEFR